MRSTPKKSRLVSISSTALSVLALGAVVAISRRSEIKAANDPPAFRRDGMAPVAPQAPAVPDLSPGRQDATAVRVGNRGLRRGSKLVAVLGSAIALLGAAGTGTAFAYIAGGHGSGSGSASGTPLAIGVTGTPIVVGTLYPGGPAASLQVQVTNPYSNTGLVVTGLSGTITVTPSPTCSPTGVTLTTPTSIANATLSGGATQTVTFNGAVIMSTSSATGCQGATFTIAGIVIHGMEG